MNTQMHAISTQTGISSCWLDRLEENNVKFMVLDPMHDAKLVEQLQSQPEWIIEFTTEDAIFFVREE